MGRIAFTQRCKQPAWKVLEPAALDLDALDVTRAVAPHLPLSAHSESRCRQDAARQPDIDRAAHLDELALLLIVVGKLGPVRSLALGQRAL